MDEIWPLALVYRFQERLEGINCAGYENVLKPTAGHCQPDDAGDPRAAP